MTNWTLRIRRVLDAQFSVVLIALVVLALLGGWLTYTAHATPNTSTEERTASSWQMSGWFNHSATVSEDNSVYPVGTTLTNRSIYFAEITPWFNGTYTLTYDASERGNLNGTVSLQFLLQSVEGDRDSTTVVWQTTSSLETSSDDSFRPGETISAPFSINVNETMNRTEIIAEELGNPPGRAEVVVRATIDVQGTVNGQPVTKVETHDLPVTLSQEIYRPAHPGTLTEKHETTRTVTVQQANDPLWSFGAPVLLFVPSLALLGVFVARRRDSIGLSPAEQELLAYREDRDDFDEWISKIQLPDDEFDSPRAEAASLGALVDFAIDTGSSVIEDPDEGSYYVVHDRFLVTYYPPSGGGEGSGIARPDESDEPEPGTEESTAVALTDGESDPSDEDSMKE